MSISSRYVIVSPPSDSAEATTLAESSAIPVTLVMVGGFLSGYRSWERFLVALSAMIRIRIIFIPSLRNGGDKKHGLLQLQATHVLGIIEDLQIQHLILLSHSMGCTIATLVEKSLPPSRLLRSIKICPAGLHPDHPVWLMIRWIINTIRTLCAGRGNASPEELAGANQDTWDYVRLGWWRTMREWVEISRFPGYKLTVELLDPSDPHNLDHVIGRFDWLFTFTRIRRALHELRESRFHVVDSGHDPHAPGTRNLLVELVGRLVLSTLNPT